MGFANGMPELEIHDKLFPDQIAKRTWKFVKALCATLIYSGNDYVVEGEALLPANLSAFLMEHENKIKPCFLGYCETTAEQKVKEIKTYKANLDDWLVKESDDYISDHVTNMIEYSKFIRKECSTYQMRYFDVSRNFNLIIDEAFRYLLD